MQRRLFVMVIAKFEQFEQGLNRLLKEHESLKAESAGLRESLDEKELEILELKDKVKKLDAEREEVKERVEILLTRLDTLIQNA